MNLTARDVMVTDVKTVSPDDDVAHVLARLGRVDFSGFPVVDDEDRVVGIVTDTDLVRLFQPEEKTLWIPVGFPPFVDTLTYQVDVPWDDIDLGIDALRNADRPVREVMTTDVETVSPDDDLDRVLDLLADADRDINRVPVVDDDGRIVGIIARQDALRAVREELRRAGERA